MFAKANVAHFLKFVHRGFIGCRQRWISRHSDIDGHIRRTRHVERLAGADGLRGLAMLIVLCGHAIALNIPDAGLYLRGVPKVGVWLFFVLSAYLLTWHLSYDRSGRSYPFRLIDYSISRFLRIVPLYSVAVYFYFLVGGAGIDTSNDVVLALTLRGGYAHLWTIPPEVKFYLLLPFIVFINNALSGQKSAFYWHLLFNCGVIAIAQWYYPWRATPENDVSVGWYVTIFVMGAMAATLRIDEHRLSFPRTLALLVSKIKNGVVGGAMVALLVPLVYIIWGKLGGLSNPSDFLLNKHWFFGLWFAILIYLVVDRQHALTFALNNRLLVRLGRISYSTYLFHWACILFFRDSFDVKIAIPLSIASSIGFGAAFYVLIEKPLGKARWISVAWISASYPIRTIIRRR